MKIKKVNIADKLKVLAKLVKELQLDKLVQYIDLCKYQHLCAQTFTQTNTPITMSNISQYPTTKTLQETDQSYKHQILLHRYGRRKKEEKNT